MQLREYPLLTRLIRTRPLFLASILLLAGCIFGYHAPLSPLIPGVLLGCLLLPALLLCRRHRRIAAALLIAAMLPLGMLRFDLAWQATSPLPDQKGALLSGRICEMPNWRADTERTICVLEDVCIDGEPSGRKLRLYLRGDVGLLQQVSLGQHIACEAHIWEADAATNPGQFNFSNYLRVNGLSGYATAEIESAVFTAPETGLRDLPKILRERLGRHIDRLFPENAPLARAFLLGDRSQLSADDRKNYSDSGAAHLLAISGMHISVLAAAINAVLSRFTGKRTGFLITMALLLLYGCLIGFTASLTRAMLMFAVFSLAGVIGRYSDSPTRLGAALLVYLLLRPTAILDTGFVLSFSASGGIVLLQKPLTSLFHAEGLLKSKLGTGLPSLLRRLGKWTVSMLISTLAAQIALLPAVVHFFGAQPLISIAANLVAVPLAMAAYIVSIMGALSCLPPVALVGDFLFGLLNDSVAVLAALPVATLRIARFPGWLTLLCAVAFLLASGLSTLSEKIRRFLPLTAILAVLISNGCAMLTTAGCSIVFLDAGQADSAVLRTQGKVYLFDAGDAYSPAADYLGAMNYPLEAVFLSHMHSDHVLGLEGILEVCTPKRIYISANWSAYEADEGVSELLAAAEERGCEIHTLAAGDRLQLSGETFLEVCSPAAGICAAAANDDSLVLRVEHGGTSALFTGDASAEAIAGIAPDADILKVAHHGAGDSLNPALLSAVSPSVAVIPTGYNNYGHPTQESLELLDLAGAQVFRTDDCGAITCRFSGGGRVTVSTYIPTPHSSEAEHGLE